MDTTIPAAFLDDAIPAMVHAFEAAAAHVALPGPAHAIISAPPGTGKTTLAGALVAALLVNNPGLRVRAHVVSSTAADKVLASVHARVSARAGYDAKRAGSTLCVVRGTARPANLEVLTFDEAARDDVKRTMADVVLVDEPCGAAKVRDEVVQRMTCAMWRSNMKIVEVGTPTDIMPSGEAALAMSGTPAKFFTVVMQ